MSIEAPPPNYTGLGGFEISNEQTNWTDFGDEFTCFVLLLEIGYGWVAWTTRRGKCLVRRVTCGTRETLFGPSAIPADFGG